MALIILAIIIVYILVVFILSRFFIPHLGFAPDPIPEELPPDLANAINQLKDKAKSQYDFLKLSYDFIGSKYKSERFNTVLKFHYLFKDLDDIWVRNGYIPCTQSNFLMRIFLVHSGQFSEGDIKIKHTFVNFILHQYLQVNVQNKWIDVDVGEKQRGIPIGKHLRFLG